MDDIEAQEWEDLIATMIEFEVAQMLLEAVEREKQSRNQE